MDPKSEAGETMFSACWLFKLTAHDVDELRRTCFRVRRRICTKLQTENQQNELYCNSEYLVIVSSKQNSDNISYHLFSRLNVTCKAAIYRVRHRKQFGGW